MKLVESVSQPVNNPPPWKRRGIACLRPLTRLIARSLIPISRAPFLIRRADSRSPFARSFLLSDLSSNRLAYSPLTIPDFRRVSPFLPNFSPRESSKWKRTIESSACSVGRNLFFLSDLRQGYEVESQTEFRKLKFSVRVSVDLCRIFCQQRDSFLRDDRAFSGINEINLANLDSVRRFVSIFQVFGVVIRSFAGRMLAEIANDR